MAIFPIEPTPMTVPGCVLWMRPQNTQASNMTASGNRLSAIKNLVNNRLLIQNPVSANQPSSGVETINGLNAIGFDSDNNRWLTTGLPATLTNISIFTVLQQVTSVTQGTVFAGTSTYQSIRMTNNNLGFSSNDSITTLTINTGTSALSAPIIAGVVANAAGATRSIYKNSVTAGASGAYSGNLGSLYFGTTSAVSGSARGGYKQGETIIYNRALSAAEISKVVNYLSNQSGVIVV